MSDRLATAVAALVEALREELHSNAALTATAPERLLGIDEAAGVLGFGRTLVYGEIAAGRLSSCKVGRRRLIPTSALSEYIAARQRARG